VAGPAAVTGPHTVVMGHNATLNCSVADPGNLYLASTFLKIFLHRHVNCSSVSKKILVCFINDFDKYFVY